MIVVTGATGHVGNVLVRKLVENEEEIRAFILQSEDLKPIEGLDIEIVEGDVRDIDSLVNAFQGAEIVYHLAGIISIMPDKDGFLYQVNVEGTRNVVNACLKTGVKRLIYISSVHALKEPPKGIIIDENCGFDPQYSRGGYDETKATASLEVLKGIDRGLEAVIICPSGIIGPYDYNISQMGTLFINYINGDIKAYLDGAYDFVDVRDVAEGIILASKHGKSGETYILSGEKIEVPELMNYLEKITGVKAPSFKAPLWLLKIFSKFTPIYYKFIKDKPLFTGYSIEVLNSNCDISSKKAQNELGFSSRPITESIKDSIEWFKENKYV
ncbi:MAG: SDR family oxidoreductase [Methanobacterium sp.]|uniref:SDR family oxidoreductase n=1 Tax=Methanobacterium sp. TaxID=2164 RepID=UPI003D656CFC|nr:SDR family oxidoreductase [Methanobacterium sp.]